MEWARSTTPIQCDLFCLHPPVFCFVIFSLVCVCIFVSSRVSCGTAPLDVKSPLGSIGVSVEGTKRKAKGTKRRKEREEAKEQHREGQHTRPITTRQHKRQPYTHTSSVCMRQAFSSPLCFVLPLCLSLFLSFLVVGWLSSRPRFEPTTRQRHDDATTQQQQHNNTQQHNKSERIGGVCARH